MKQTNKTKLVVLTSLFAAMIFIGTRISIPLGINNRIVHLGDAMVYLSASILPLPYAMVSSAIGAGLSDFTTPGCMIWVFPTMVIKPILVTFFTSRDTRLLCKRNKVAIFLAGITGLVLYAIVEGVIYGSFITAIIGIPGDALQPIGSAVLFVTLSHTFDAMKLKERLKLNKDFNNLKKISV